MVHIDPFNFYFYPIKDSMDDICIVILFIVIYVDNIDLETKNLTKKSILTRIINLSRRLKQKT